MTLSLALALAALVAVPASFAGRAALPACSGSALKGSLKVIPGSAGAGNIVYRLRLRNASSAPCTISGIPGLTLLSATGKTLPTKVIRVGTTHAVLLALAAGKTATLTTRFSPDVPGPGESQTGPCEQTAASVRVKPAGGGAAIIPIAPPTPVCEHGTLQATTLVAA